MEEIPKYKIGYFDPPWSFEPWGDQTNSLVKSPQMHYDCMSIDEMCGLPVKELFDDNALAACWTYDPMYPEALRLMKAWGFEYVTVLFRWLKTTEDPGQLHLFPIELPSFPIATGYHTRTGGCEECWLFKRGNGLPVLRHDIRREFYSMVREHSRKPDQVRDWIVDLYGPQPRVEFFARTRTQGWDIMFSNQADKFK